MMKNMIQHTVRSVAQIFSGKKKTKKKKSIDGPTQTTTTTHKFTESITAVHKPDVYSTATENLPNEIDGRTDYKKDATRYGDWEHKGRCIDF